MFVRLNSILKPPSSVLSVALAHLEHFHFAAVAKKKIAVSYTAFLNFQVAVDSAIFAGLKLQRCHGEAILRARVGVANGGFGLLQLRLTELDDGA
jgi:hypothetical protein